MAQEKLSGPELKKMVKLSKKQELAFAFSPGKKRDGHLVMIDRLARYPSARWFLNQFNCSLVPGPCSPDADELVTESLQATGAAEAGNLLIEAEGALLAQEAYIPLGAPVRWSLVRGGLEGFSENPWARHPLYALAGAEAW